MQQSFWNATSGLKTQQFGVDVWSNNIANINTIGYKSKSPHFSTLHSSYLSSMNGGNSNVSTQDYGSTVSSSKNRFTAATTKKTEGDYDLAILKNGFFVVDDVAGNLSYTRDGSFIRDANGYLTTSNGNFVQGVDAGLSKNGFFSLSDKNSKILNTDKMSDLSKIHIPQFAQIKAEQTTDVDVAISLSANNHIVPIEESHNYKEQRYARGNYSAVDEEMSSLYDIKAGDVFSVSFDAQTASYTYGTDFTTINELRDKLRSSNLGIGVDFQNSKILFTNKNKTSKLVDFSGSTPSLLSSLGLNDKTVMHTGDYISTYGIGNKPMLSIGFNALNGVGNRPLSIQKGDDISMTIDGVKHSFYYGKSNETIGDGVVQGEDSTFLTVGDFLKIYKNKTGLNASIKDSKIQFKSSGDPEVFVSSNNQSMLLALGLSPTGSHIKEGDGLLGNPLSVSTYAHSNTIYDKNGVKYHIETKYILKNREDKDLDTNQSWSAVSSILDSRGVAVDSHFYTSTLVFKDPLKPPQMYDAEGKEIEHIELKFLKNDPIKYRFVDKKNDSFTQTYLSGQSRVIDYTANGSTAGTQDGILIDSQGFIRLNFSNSQQFVLGRIAVVDFINPQGLSSSGSNEYKTKSKIDSTLVSGDPTLLWGSNGVLKTALASGRLENSNVDLSEGLTELIALQRAFGANSKAVTASDEMEQEAINLKR